MFPTLVLRILEIPFISLANGAGIYFSISSPIFSMAGITILGKTLLKYKYEYLKKNVNAYPGKASVTKHNLPNVGTVSYLQNAYNYNNRLDNMASLKCINKYHCKRLGGPVVSASDFRLEVSGSRW